jgi:hypothetical protein
MYCSESNMMDYILRICIHILFPATMKFVLLETCIEKSKEMLELHLDLNITYRVLCESTLLPWPSNMWKQRYASNWKAG